MRRSRDVTRFVTRFLCFMPEGGDFPGPLVAARSLVPTPYLHSTMAEEY
jgi:hypothetical protein